MALEQVGPMALQAAGQRSATSLDAAKFQQLLKQQIFEIAMQSLMQQWSEKQAMARQKKANQAALTNNLIGAGSTLAGFGLLGLGGGGGGGGGAFTAPAAAAFKAGNPAVNFDTILQTMSGYNR